MIPNAPNDCPADPLNFKDKKPSSSFSDPYFSLRWLEILVPTVLWVFLILYSFSITFIFPICSLISGKISWSKVSGTEFISETAQYLVFSPESVWANKGFRSKSSKFDDALLTCLNKSVLPIIHLMI